MPALSASPAGVLFDPNWRRLDAGSLRPTRCTTRSRGDPEPIDFQETDTTSQSAGKVTTTLKVAHSCTQTESPDASLRSLAIPPPKYTIGLNRKLVRRRPTKRKSPACLQNKVPKAFGLTDRSEERAQRYELSYPQGMARCQKISNMFG